jgi:outer membrane lipoprotein-sorting protein
MKTAIVSALVVLSAMSINCFAQGSASSPKSGVKTESNMIKTVATNTKQKYHFSKKHQSQEKEPAAKKSGS